MVQKIESTHESGIENHHGNSKLEEHHPDEVLEKYSEKEAIELELERCGTKGQGHHGPKVHAKAQAQNAYNTSVPGLGRSLRDGNDNPLQHSCLENPMDRGIWRATVHGATRVGHNLATIPSPPPPAF